MKMNNNEKIIQMLQSGQPDNQKLALKLIQSQNLINTQWIKDIKTVYEMAYGTINEEDESLQWLITIFNAEILDLSSKSLDYLPYIISKLTNIKHLYLDNNNLNNIPSVLLDLENLQRLYLANNGISFIPREISTLKMLQALGLEKTPIKSLPKTFINLQWLRWLYLVDTQVQPEEVERLRTVLHEDCEIYS